MQLVQCLFGAARGAVGAVGHDRVVRVADGDDARPERMSSPAVPSVALAVPALVAGTPASRPGRGGRGGHDALADEGVAAHEGPLVVVQWPRLVEDGVGDGDLAHVVQLGGDPDVVERLALQAQVAAHRFGQVRHTAEVPLEAGVALGERAREHVGALAPRRRAAGVLVCVHPLVGGEQRVGRDGRLLRDGDGAIGGGDREAITVLDHRGGRKEFDLTTGTGIGEHAELVAAQPIGAPVGLDAVLERLAQRARSASPARCPKESL
jgi:hypothetical protein